MHLRKRQERPLWNQIDKLPQKRIVKLRLFHILKQAVAFSEMMTFLIKVRKPT